MLPPLPSVELPPWLRKVEGAQTSYCLVAEDKSIFLFDCGFPPIVESLSRMVSSGEISGVDAIWATHYHDDHTASINAVRRKYGGKVCIQEELQDILENPTAYCMPALLAESIHIDHVLSDGEVIHWKGYTLTACYFSGQTLYHDGLPECAGINSRATKVRHGRLPERDDPARSRRPESEVNGNSPVDGSIIQFTPYGQYSDGKTRIMNNNAASINVLGTWTSSNQLVIQIPATGNGVATAWGPGTANVHFTAPSGDHVR